MTSIPDLPKGQREKYQEFSSGIWEGWIRRDYQYPGIESDLSNPREMFNDGRVKTWLKQGRNRLAIISWPQESRDCEGSMVLKSYEPGSGFNRLRLMRGKPRALRHWDACWMLRGKGIRTPSPVLIAMNQSSGNDQGILGVETINNCTTIRKILRSTESAEQEVVVGSETMQLGEFAALCGRYAREVHDHNIVHRDFSGANLLIPDDWHHDETRQLVGQFIMLDINRIRNVSEGQMNINLRIQDLERLGVPEEALGDYYNAYAGEDENLREEWPRFLKYRKGYRRIRETRNPLARGLLKSFTYWPRTG